MPVRIFRVLRGFSRALRIMKVLGVLFDWLDDTVLDIFSEIRNRRG